MANIFICNTIGKRGDEIRDSLAKLGFQVPTLVVMESLDIAPEEQFNETDIPTFWTITAI